MLKVALTHDVDRAYKTYQYVTRMLRYLKRANLKEVVQELVSITDYADVFWNFPEIMEMEEGFGVRSTFFFLNESIPFELFNINNWKLSLGRYKYSDKRIRSIISSLDKNGWEIGVHGSYNSYNNLELLLDEKQSLEHIVGHAVHGIRQHYLNMNDRTWQIQREAGFRYDSTWGYTDKLGYKDDIVAPFHPFNDSFTEFPLSIMDSCYMEDPMRDVKVLELIKATDDKDGILVLNWHSNSYNPRDYPGYKESYKKMIELLKSHGARFVLLGDEAICKSDDTIKAT